MVDFVKLGIYLGSIIMGGALITFGYQMYKARKEKKQGLDPYAQQQQQQHHQQPFQQHQHHQQPFQQHQQQQNPQQQQGQYYDGQPQIPKQFQQPQAQQPQQQLQQQFQESPIQSPQQMSDASQVQETTLAGDFASLQQDGMMKQMEAMKQSMADKEQELQNKIDEVNAKIALKDLDQATLVVEDNTKLADNPDKVVSEVSENKEVPKEDVKDKVEGNDIFGNVTLTVKVPDNIDERSKGIIRKTIDSIMEKSLKDMKKAIKKEKLESDIEYGLD